MNSLTRRVVAVVVVAGVLVSSAACSSAVHKASTAGAKLVDPPIGRVFDGVTLAGMVGKVAFPAGFTVNPQWSQNSGPTVAADSAQELPDMSCGDFTDEMGASGFGEQSWANEAAASATHTLDLTAYQFATNALAQGFYAQTAAKWSGCGSFTVTGQDFSQDTVLSRSPGPAVWGASAVSVLSETATVVGHIDNVAYVMALDGDTVVITAAIAIPGPLFAGALKSAAGLDGQLLMLMNAAQLLPAPTPSGGPRVGVGGTQRPV